MVGVGIQEEELKANPVLTSYYVQDLNLNPYLQMMGNESVDLVLCTFSINLSTKVS